MLLRLAPIEPDIINCLTSEAARINLPTPYQQPKIPNSGPEEKVLGLTTAVLKHKC